MLKYLFISFSNNVKVFLGKKKFLFIFSIYYFDETDQFSLFSKASSA